MTGRSIKVSLVGDGAVGKTCLWNVYTRDFFPPEYEPNVLDECTITVELRGQMYSLTIWDTAGQEDYDRLRHLTYPNTDVFVVCYAINCSSSFGNVWSKWIPEIKERYPNIPIILVGTKVDTRNAETSGLFVSSSLGQKKSKEIGAKYFIECSALERINVESVFKKALKSALGLSENRCTIL